MDLIIDFIVDNYIWFAIGVVVILMIIIGFIAEKTDFGRKPFGSSKKEKEVSNEEPVEVPVVEEVAQNSDALDDLDNNELPDLSSAEEIEEPAAYDEPEIAGENIADIPTDGAAVSDDDTEDLNVPFGDQEVDEPVADDSDLVPEVEEESSEDDVWKF